MARIVVTTLVTASAVVAFVGLVAFGMGAGALVMAAL